MNSPMLNEVVLEVSNLAVGYGRTAVVFDASLVVRRGEIAVIVGPNGSGKSTLLKGIVGVLPPSTGTVNLRTDRQVNTTGIPPESLAHMGVAYVPQLANVFASLSITENLIVGIPKQGRADRIETVYSLFPDLRPAASRPARTLSGGQRMMLALGRALMTEPSVVIVDEPCAGLSPRYRDVVWNQLVQLRSAGVGLLVVEQNTHAALETGDYGYILVAGRVRREGSATSLLSDTELIDLYIGRSAQPD
jgi:branched-chain amino acid transport system ATP-binding protein